MHIRHMWAAIANLLLHETQLNVSVTPLLAKKSLRVKMLKNTAVALQFTSARSYRGTCRGGEISTRNASVRLTSMRENEVKSTHLCLCMADSYMWNKGTADIHWHARVALAPYSTIQPPSIYPNSWQGSPSSLPWRSHCLACPALLPCALFTQEALALT